MISHNPYFYQNNLCRKMISGLFSVVIAGFLVVIVLFLLNQEAAAMDTDSRGATYAETLKTLDSLIKLYDHDNSDQDATDSRSVENSLFEFLGTLPRQQLVRLLNHKNSKICSLSAHLLGEKWQAVDSLIMIIKTNKDNQCQWAAIEALHNNRLGDARAVKPLIARLVDKNEDARVRGQAAFLLGEIGDLRSVPALRSFSSFDDQFVSEMALLAWTTLINSWTIDTLRLKLKDPDPEIRSAAAIVLSEKL